MDDPKPPRGTGRAGRALWGAVTGSFVLEPHELAVLRQMAVVADRIAALDAVVDQQGVLVGDRAHRALIESRLQRLTLGRLMVTLRLPDREERRPQRRGGFRGTYRLRQVVGGDGH